MKDIKRKIIVLALVVAVGASMLCVTGTNMQAASKHKSCSDAFLNCSSYKKIGEQGEATLYRDAAHHYIGLSSIGAFYDMRVTIKKSGLKSYSFTLENMASEKRVPKRFRGKKCKVSYYATKKGKRKTHTITKNNVKL